jgi:hypothetical protein
VGSGAQERVGPGQGREFGNPQARLDGERQQRVVAPPGSGCGVRCGEQCGGFGLGEIGDELAVGPLGRDGQDALDDSGVIEVAQCREAEQRVDRGQPGVAGADAVAALVSRWSRNAPISGASRSVISSREGCLPAWRAAKARSSRSESR